jgi:Flp pilus assembly protein TadG
MIRRLTMKRLLRGDNGASAVEFALIFPFFFLMLFGIFDFARACWVANSLQFAVAQGARYVMTNPTGSGKPTGANCGSTAWDSATYTGNITTAMQAQLANWYLSTASVPPPIATLDCEGSPPTLKVTMGASYTFTFMLTDLVGLFRDGLLMNQQAEVKIPLG